MAETAKKKATDGKTAVLVDAARLAAIQAKVEKASGFKPRASEVVARALAAYEVK